MLKVFRVFAKKNLIIRAEMTFLRKNAIWYVFYSKCATFRDFENIQVLCEKPIYFFKKDSNFERFEKSYYFSRILRQICYNLV